MRIAICVKQVPATADVQIDRVTKRLKRENNAVEMNACDCYALELALRLREKYGASVTAFTMGLCGLRYICYGSYPLLRDKGRRGRKRSV